MGGSSVEEDKKEAVFVSEEEGHTSEERTADGCYSTAEEEDSYTTATKMQSTKSPERQSVKAPEKTAHEKIISAPGRPEWPHHEKYDLDEVVTDKLPDGPQYIIIRAYLQQREGEEFNVDLPAYFCRFLNDAKYYFFKGPMSKYFHEANYTDIEGRFKRGKAVSNRILWYDDLSNASVGKEGIGGRYIAKQTAAGPSVWLPGPFQGRVARLGQVWDYILHW